MKRWFIGVLVIAGIGGLLIYFLTFDQNEKSHYIKVSGNVETTEINIGFKISGRIVHLSAQEGDRVEKGQEIARLDDEDLRQRL
ncbi:MAG: biotin/lipoyl-binding protein, partial [Deltaproteobacteria bacterium]|nr:biotin/lipoyl-binding protein [Deltaproteobacteria bacterium]